MARGMGSVSAQQHCTWRWAVTQPSPQAGEGEQRVGQYNTMPLVPPIVTPASAARHSRVALSLVCSGLHDYAAPHVSETQSFVTHQHLTLLGTAIRLLSS